MPQLFRREALRAQDRLHGELSLAPPVSWQLLGVFLAGTMAVAGAFLAMGQYAKATVVTGTLTGNRGVVRAVAARTGTLSDLLVSEGQHVRHGQPLARLSVAATADGATLQDQRLAAIAEEARAVEGRGPALAAAAGARVDSFQADLASAAASARDLDAQIAEQRGLVQSAEQDLAQANTVAQRGFISKRDIRLRETELAERRQALARLQGDAATLAARVAAARAGITQARAELSGQTTAVAEARAQLRRASLEDGNARALTVVAAVDGIVTGVAAHPGDPVGPDAPIASIVPDGSQLQATLEVPPGAAGLLRPGQPVRVAVDAYPYQLHGTVPARLASVSTAAVPVARADGTRAEAFVARATLASATLVAYGRPQPLRAGMSVSARIQTEPRSFARWLLDPLFAVGRR